jgi:hypothetical protein
LRSSRCGSLCFSVFLRGSPAMALSSCARVRAGGKSHASHPGRDRRVRSISCLTKNGHEPAHRCIPPGSAHRAACYEHPRLQILREVPTLYWFGLLIAVAAVVSYTGALLVGAPAYATLRSRGWTACRASESMRPRGSKAVTSPSMMQDRAGTAASALTSPSNCLVQSYPLFV